MKTEFFIIVEGVCSGLYTILGYFEGERRFAHTHYASANCERLFRVDYVTMRQCVNRLYYIRIWLLQFRIFSYRLFYCQWLSDDGPSG